MILVTPFVMHEDDEIGKCVPLSPSSETRGETTSHPSFCPIGSQIDTSSPLTDSLGGGPLPWFQAQDSVRGTNLHECVTKHKIKPILTLRHC